MLPLVDWFILSVTIGFRVGTRKIDHVHVVTFVVEGAQERRPLLSKIPVR